MESSVTKLKSSEGKSCRKKVVLANDDSKYATKILNHPLKENIVSNTAVRKVNSCLNSNKPQPISLKQNSVLRVKKKIRDVENAQFKPFKDSSELPITSQVTLEEKITKHMNFPVEKKLYKQLISLNLTEKQPSQTTAVSYEPAVRDREPKLENYFCPKFAPEEPIPVNITFPPHSCTRTYNAFRTYQIMKSWKK